MTYNIESNAFSLPTPTRSEHAFTGWTGSGSGTSITIPKGTTGNLSYTANWYKYKYIYFLFNGGSGEKPSTITFTNESAKFDCDSNKPTRSGYIFMGWSATETYSESNKRVDYGGTQGATVTSSWTYSQWCSNTGGSTSSDTLYLYAQWKQDPNAGTNESFTVYFTRRLTNKDSATVKLIIYDANGTKKTTKTLSNSQSKCTVYDGGEISAEIHSDVIGDQQYIRTGGHYGVSSSPISTDVADLIDEYGAGPLWIVNLVTKKTKHQNKYITIYADSVNTNGAW